MDPSLPTDKKPGDEARPSEQIEEETEKQAKAAPTLLTPMYLEFIEWMGSDLVTVLMKDEFKQVKYKFLASRSTLKESRDDLISIFKEEAEK